MRTRQRGVALLVALLVVALAVILIAALLDRGELAYARARNGLRQQQAEAYAQGLEAYAAQILLVSSEQPQPDTNASPWAFPLPPQSVPGGTISATMRDRNGCFNLNNLGPRVANGTQWQAVFGHLINLLGVDPGLANAIIAWLGGEADAADANYYLALPVPYRPRGGNFTHVSELRLVRGVTAEVYARLAPYLCALPPGTRLNVNTASVPLLQSLATPPLSASTAQSLWNDGHASYTDPNYFLTDPALKGATMLTNVSALLTANSSYFEAHGDIVLDDVPFAFTSVIERPKGGGAIRVLERSRGSDDALTEAAPLQGRRDDADSLQ